MLSLSENNSQKLVRDNIPAIIKKSDRNVIYRKSKNREEMLSLLGQKLIEESKEYTQNQETEELVDILEVIYTILDLTKTSIDKLQEIRRNKKQIKGGFEKGFILLSIND